MGGKAVKRLLLALVLGAAMVTAASLSRAQTVPRAPVVRVRPTVAPAPTPTPLPDPTGVYTGNVSLNISGAGTVTQTWRADLQARPCPECVPGQYYLDGTNFNATTFNNGAVERGGVHGSINSNGQAFDLRFLAINCPFVNPSGNIGSAPYSGDMWGGNFGESLGVPLLVQNGTITGRISGRDCFGRLLTADASLQRQSTSLPAGCGSIAGSYSATFANTCSGPRRGTITINQTGCYLSTSVEVFGAVIEGTMTSPTSATIRINDQCGTAIYGGTATINGGTITGTYSGFSTGGPGCCPAGPVSGSFALTKN